MTHQSEPEQTDCQDDDAPDDILPPEAHDLIEVEQVLIWELDDWAAYKITSECRRDGCQAQYRSVDVLGEKIERVQTFKTFAYQLYESYYDDPRTIPYLVLQRLIVAPDTGTLNAIADDLKNVASLACHDADADREKRTKQELFDVALHDNV